MSIHQLNVLFHRTGKKFDLLLALEEAWEDKKSKGLPTTAVPQTATWLAGFKIKSMFLKSQSELHNSSLVCQDYDHFINTSLIQTDSWTICAVHVHSPQTANVRNGCANILHKCAYMSAFGSASDWTQNSKVTPVLSVISSSVSAFYLSLYIYDVVSKGQVCFCWLQLSGCVCLGKFVTKRIFPLTLHARHCL